MTKRTAIYARYSDADLQKQTSIEDQVRLCEEKANAEGWQVVKYYSDAGISGASLLTRSGIQELMRDANEGAFDIVLCEALDRLSRDQEDSAGIYKRMVFAEVKIFTLAEGEINELHIGLKGTYNAMYLSDLAVKTRRGQRGRVEGGKSGGGIGYGYRVVKQFDAHGEAIRGDREIDEAQAAIVQRVFEEYARHNKSPRAIAVQLNKEGIPSPSGGQWIQSTINGNRRRGTGILNNELYIGSLVWNRQRFVKNPSSGKRVTRLNDPSQWITKDMPELRIIPQKLWDAAKARQQSLDHQSGGMRGKTRPQYLLSGLLKCGCCGGGFAKINNKRYGCSVARNKGESACDNKRTIAHETLENTVLDALQKNLMRDDLLQAFCDEYTKHMNRLVARQGQVLRQYTSEQAKLEKEREQLIQAIKDGVPGALVKDDLIRVTDRQEELKKLIATHDAKPKPLLHPAMAHHYKQEVQALRTSLNDEAFSAEAKEHIRALVDKIILTPKAGEDGLSIDLHGDLAGILSIANDNRSTEGQSMTAGDKTKLLEIVTGNAGQNFEESVKLVAGARFELTTFGL